MYLSLTNPEDPESKAPREMHESADEDQMHQQTHVQQTWHTVQQWPISSHSSHQVQDVSSHARTWQKNIIDHCLEAFGKELCCFPLGGGGVRKLYHHFVLD